MRKRDSIDDIEAENQSGGWRSIRFILGAAAGLLIAAVIVGGLSLPTKRDTEEVAGQGEAPVEAPSPTKPEAQPVIDSAQAPSDPIPSAEDSTAQSDVAEISEAQTPEASEVPSPSNADPLETDQVAAKAPVAPLPIETSLNPLEPEAVNDNEDADLPAWTRNAVAFTIPPGTPKIALVLENPEVSDVPQDLILSLGLPVTMAISPVDNAAVSYGERARSAGFEIVARLPILDRRSPGSEADVIDPSMSADEIGSTVLRLVNNMPEAVAVSGADGRLVASNAGLIEAVMLALKPDGYAFLDDSGQRNAVASEIAQRLEMVAVGDVRVASGAMTDEQVYRLLDAAAQAAGNSGSVVVTAPTSAAVLIGLQRWALERNGKPARLVPLSAVLSNE